MNEIEGVNKLKAHDRWNLTLHTIVARDKIKADLERKLDDFDYFQDKDRIPHDERLKDNLENSITSQANKEGRPLEHIKVIYPVLIGEQIKRVLEISDKEGIPNPDYMCALALSELLLKQDLHDSIAYGNLGYLYSLDSNLSSTSMSIKLYRKAMELAPDKDGKANYNLGNILRKIGLVDEAIVHLSEAAKLNPTNISARYNLGVIYQFEKQDLALAVRYYDEALKINPNLTEAHTNLGVVYLALGKVDEAITEFNKAVEHNPNKMTAPLLDLGMIYLKKGAKHLQEAVGIDSELGAIYQDVINTIEKTDKNTGEMHIHILPSGK